MIAEYEERAPARKWLAQALRDIEANETNYDRRYFFVVQAAYYALQCGYEAGIRFDPEQPAWPVVTIELPTGQVSWHMPEHFFGWDGHSTEEKYARCRTFCAATEQE